MTELLPEVFDTGKAAAAEALAEIRRRSFSGRHPDLGKMFKCQVCGRRHRSSVQHAQVFAHRWTVTDGQKVYTDEELIAGRTPETETVVVAKKIRVIIGAAAFKGKRKHPPLNKRSNEFVQLVRSLVPDEYTQEDLKKARTRARFALVEKYGRYGFMMPEWQSRKEADVRKAEVKAQDLGSKETVQSPEAEIPIS